MKRWYPDLDDVLAIQIRRFGGSPGIRDMGLVEMGLFRPQTGYYKDVIAEAAALWESFMQNHPFIDGNICPFVCVSESQRIYNCPKFSNCRKIYLRHVRSQHSKV